MNLEPSLPHLHAIELPTPFPVGPITVYLAEAPASAPGEPLTLIDTGPLAAEAQAALEAGLRHLGYALTDLERILVTHAHADHFGLAANLVAASGAQVLTHSWNLSALGDYLADRERRVQFYAALLRQAAVPSDILRAVGQATRGVNRFARPVAVDDTLAEGDTLRLAGRTWQVFHTPGHAAGLICLYEPVSRTLLSSDHLLADISSNPLVEPPPPGQSERLRSLALYRESLQRIASSDVAQALPSHGPVIRDVSGLVRQRLAFHKRRVARVLDTLHNGARTTWDVTYALFPDRSPLDTFLAVSELIGHLDLLEMEGRIAGEEKRGVIYWKLLPDSGEQV
ncbi:MAG: MBL fold metallo-hydrolase [Anaerolineae bacterium]|jgi:glyoxylase-like metal-dependent hydrolase (beta-lactamase superfamily II)